MFELVRDKVFPFIKSLGDNGDSEGDSTYTHHMKDRSFHDAYSQGTGQRG